MTNIIKHYPKNAAENPDNVLEQAVGHYQDVLILGWNKLDCLEIRSSLGLDVRDLLVLVEVFKFKLLNGDYSDD